MGSYSRKERIESFLEENTRKLLNNLTKDTKYLGFSTEYISSKLNLTRSNVSKELNDLFREEKLVKISGKPVLYLTASFITDLVNKDKDDHYVIEKEELEQQLFNRVDIDNEQDILNSMIGSQGSLKSIVEQLKAATIYPPNGLDILLLGSTGVGKSTLAYSLFLYSKQQKIIDESASFISFNCADYTDNPQLLLSILFGYTKGAFTGANEEKEGLIKHAENGFLFLDEVHRLPPQGQEMLFQVIDNGVYRKMGQVDFQKINRLKIILATTEDTNSTLLNTFIRRIPVIVTLPDLKDRFPSERMEYILNFFSIESNSTKKDIIIKKEVFEALLSYDAQGNLGQLNVDIKLTCAKAYLQMQHNRIGPLEIKFSHLPEHVIQSYLESKNTQKKQIKDYIARLEASTYISYSNLNNHIAIRNSIHELTAASSLNIYSHDSKKFDLEFEDELVNQLDIIQEEKNLQTIEKIVHPTVYSAINESMNKLNLILDPNTIFGLMLHINTLREKIYAQKNIRYPKTEDLKTRYPNEYSIAIQLRNLLNKVLDFYIPEGEITFLTLFLNISINNTNKNHIGILVLSHGEYIATNMAKLVNNFLSTDHVDALDFPLNESSNEFFQKVFKKIQKLDRGKGVLILSDMGSLTLVAELAKEKYNIDVQNISPVSTLMLLEATRKALIPQTTISNLVDSLKESFSIPEPVDENFIPTDSKLIETLRDLLLFIDPIKVTPLLESILQEILLQLNLSSNDGLKIKFLFHCSSMIERVIIGESLPYKNSNSVIKSNELFFSVIKESFSLLNSQLFITVPDTELLYILEIFDTHFKDQLEILKYQK